MEISQVLLTPTRKLQILRDDKLCFGMGTKIRKALGLLDFLRKNQIEKIRLVGSLHSNFLSAYSFLFSISGFNVEVFAYHRNANLRSANSKIIRNYASEIFLFSTRKECLDSLGKDSEENEFLVPEYGFHHSALLKLNDFWEMVKNRIAKPTLLFLEIGSGLSFISAASFFKNTSVKVVGILIGERKDRFLKKLPLYLKSIHLTETDLGEYILLEPEQNKKFGEVNEELIRKTKEVYHMTGIMLEPIYSTKSWKCMEDFSDPGKNFFLSQEDKESDWLYLHQGGLLNHLDRILDPKAPKPAGEHLV